MAPVVPHKATALSGRDLDWVHAERGLCGHGRLDLRNAGRDVVKEIDVASLVLGQLDALEAVHEVALLDAVAVVDPAAFQKTLQLGHGQIANAGVIGHVKPRVRDGKSFSRQLQRCSFSQCQAKSEADNAPSSRPSDFDGTAILYTVRERVRARLHKAERVVGAWRDSRNETQKSRAAVRVAHFGLLCAKRAKK
eukprot:scaffold1136_cov260-Pinguiococcus_pyrenoidosus.AAC.10